MKVLKSITLVAAILFTSHANADIYDRIDRCESNPGWSCMFSILREMVGMIGNTSAPQVVIESGAYNRVSGSCYNTKVEMFGNRLTLDFRSGTSIRTFTCAGHECKGDSHPNSSVTLDSPVSFTYKNRNTCRYKKAGQDEAPHWGAP